MSGVSLDFSEGELRKAAESYDPSVHEAPLTVGHPKDNLPAYGWVSGLSFSEESGIEADTSQVDAEFAELVNSGRFKKISASWYTPDAPSNPVPGVYYLRHVGFLGAQPPAVKGLRDAAFSEDEEGVISFEDSYSFSILATMMRRLREWIISKEGVDEADKVLPDFMVAEVEQEARSPSPEAAVSPSFSEPIEGDMTKEELDAIQAKLDQQKADQDAQAASFSEREKAIAKREGEIRREAVATKVDALIASGKAPKGKRDAMISFMCSFSETELVEFSEGENTVKQTPAEFFAAFVDELPSAVAFGEAAEEDDSDDNGTLTALEISKKAQSYTEEQAAKGVTVSWVDAIDAVTK